MDVHHTLREALRGARIGEPRTFGGLTVIPLFGRAEAEAEAGGGGGSGRGHVTLDEALDAGTARITEVDEAGSVPELRLENRGELPVLLLDGEELVGAKQNRVLNLTVLAPAGETVVIPVSCVEQGRWRSESAAFQAAAHVMVTGARAKKVRQVSRSLAFEDDARSDQGEVWRDVERSARRYGVRSATGAMREIYERHRRGLDEYVAAFPPEEGQTGAVFAVAGVVRGVEAFGHAGTLAALLPKVVRSWALEAIDSPARAHGVPGAVDARAFLDQVAGASVRAHESIGLGEDVRIDGHAVAGGALVHDGSVVHLCAFRSDVDSDADAGRRSARHAPTFRTGRLHRRR